MFQSLVSNKKAKFPGGTSLLTAVEVLSCGRSGSLPFTGGSKDEGACGRDGNGTDFRFTEEQSWKGGCLAQWMKSKVLVRNLKACSVPFWVWLQARRKSSTFSDAFTPQQSGQERASMLKVVLLQNKEMFLLVCHFRDRRNFFFYQPRHYIAVPFLLIAFANVLKRPD